MGKLKKVALTNQSDTRPDTPVDERIVEIRLFSYRISNVSIMDEKELSARKLGETSAHGSA